MAGVTAVELSCAELSVREVNTALRGLPDGSAVRITEPRGRHNLAVGLTNRLDITIAGNASECAGASARGGLIVIDGDASSRAGISLKGGAIAIAGDVGHMSGFMAQAGTILIGGDAADSLGDSLYEAVIYVGGKIRSLGADAQVEELSEDDVRRVAEMAAAAGFSHVSAEDVTRVASAKHLYNFDALKDQKY